MIVLYTKLILSYEHKKNCAPLVNEEVALSLVLHNNIGLQIVGCIQKNVQTVWTK